MVEGYLDCIALHQAGFENAVAVYSFSAVNPGRPQSQVGPTVTFAPQWDLMGPPYHQSNLAVATALWAVSSISQSDRPQAGGYES